MTGMETPLPQIGQVTVLGASRDLQGSKVMRSLGQFKVFTDKRI